MKIFVVALFIMKLKQTKCPVIGKLLSDMMYILVKILCSHLNYIYINSGKVYVKEKGFYYKE